MKRKNTNLSKSTLIRSIQCQKSLYLYKNFFHLRDPISKEQKAVFNRGHSIGEMAQGLFPGGKNVAPKSPRFYNQSLNATAYLIEQKFPVIYEAAFRINGIVVFLDILVLKNDKWYAYEVKSSKKVSETYIQDAAIQFNIINKSGINLADFSIIYVHKDYNYYTEEEWDLNEIFLEQSVLKEIEVLQPYIESVIIKAKATLSGNQIPDISMGNHCETPYSCDFKGFCSKT